MTNQNEGNTASAARRVADAWENSNARNLDGFYVTEVKGNTVQLGHLEYGSDDTLDWVDVWFGHKVGSPAFRLLNPDLWVQDRHGDIIVKEDDGRGGHRTIRFREDPLQAVAETISDVRSGN